MSQSFDFKAQSAVLLQKLSQNPVTSANRELIRAAIEVALRDAYAHGVQAAQGKAASSSKPMLSRPHSAPSRPAKPAQPQVREAPECAHDWEDTFLDGRSVGSRCVHCEILQKDVQEKCEHYFVQTGSGEVCVACRKARRKASVR